ncbi:hypothetical protein F511_45696 [Dorcoceras hygrometricum]|uniref:Uncharacterized protein n=1 Tax=Dorcoceras hygrometricum TaxID=472368 RepID=A0A2Z7A2Z8_9LAMI|nr:hypothetical protein F511_45696 [Dorcoceras hygrometricum]
MCGGPPLPAARMCARLIARRAQEPARWPRLVAQRRAPLRAMVARCRAWRSAAAPLRLPRLSRALAALVARCGRHSRKRCAAGWAPLVAGRCDVAGMLLCDGRLMCAAAGPATCDELRADVRRAWRDVARGCRAIFRVAPPPTGRRSGEAPAMS